MHRILLLLVLAAGLGSCGTCLLVLSCNVEFRAPDGATYAGVVEYRQPAGLLNLDDSPIGAARPSSRFGAIIPRDGSRMPKAAAAMPAAGCCSAPSGPRC